MADDLLQKGILVVDDDPTVCQMVSLTLESLGFSLIYQAATMAECLAILAERGEEIYVVLLDLKLPDGFGLGVMQHLANSHEHIVGIVVITAHPDVESVSQFYQLGTEQIVPVHYETKPLTRDLLADQVTRATRLIDGKRKRQGVILQDHVWAMLQTLNDRVGDLSGAVNQLDRFDRLEQRLVQLEKKYPSFLKQLAMTVISTIVVGLAVIALLYFGIGTLLAEVIARIP